MKTSKTGKPLCCQCRKLATHILAGVGYDRIASAPMTLLYCTDHAREGSKKLCHDCRAAPVKYPGVASMRCVYGQAQRAHAREALARGTDQADRGSVVLPAGGQGPARRSERKYR